MTVLLFEPFAGIAGDMTVGALLDLGASFDRLEAGLRRLPLSGWSIRAEPAVRGAFAGTRFLVETDEHHPHRTMADVRTILAEGDLPARARERALAAFEKLAVAEGRAHGLNPEAIHFHEVGAVDSILDMVGAALLLEELGVTRVLTTPVRVGTGEVECRHGRIPVPAPGTAALLEGLPVRYAEGEGETTTPTGAALLAAWAEPLPAEFAARPLRTGYGAGARDDTPLPNLLRATLLDPGPPAGDERDRVIEVAANLDDQSPEAVAFAMERLFAAGALDAWATPVVMKKGRPALVLAALVPEAGVAAVEAVFFAETTTIGVRRRPWDRTKLARTTETVKTPWGPVRVKVARRDGAETLRAPEYEDCARIAREHGVPFREVHAAALRPRSDRIAE